MSKYETWYSDITTKAKKRDLTEYTEIHHIIPKSMGGDDSVENLVKLTPREHFICHWLLTKMTVGEDHWKMLNALRIMRAENPRQTRYTTKITSRVYDKLKKEYAQLLSEKFKGNGNGMFGKTHSEEAKEKIRQKNLGNKLTPEQHAKLVANTKGKKKSPITDEHRKNLSNNHRSKKEGFDGSLSDETRKKIGDKIRGRKQTEEEKKARSIANMGKTKPKKLCEHCGQMVAVNGYARWHGTNCKKVKENG